MHSNSWPGQSLGLRSTRAAAVATAQHTDTVEVDLSSALLFPRQRTIPQVQYTLEVKDEANTFARHALVPSSRPGVVTVRTEVPLAQATLRVSVDQSLDWRPPPAAGPPFCGNSTGDLPCKVMLTDKLCEDKGSLIGGAGKDTGHTVQACFEWCKADPTCRFFGFIPAVDPWCER